MGSCVSLRKVRQHDPVHSTRISPQVEVPFTAGVPPSAFEVNPVTESGGASEPDVRNTPESDHYINLSEKSFQIGKILALGGFAAVCRCLVIDYDKMCAVKRMSKALLLKKRAVPMVWSERDIMARLQVAHASNPFLVQLICVIQTELEILFVMQLVLGGDLMDALRHNYRKLARKRRNSKEKSVQQMLQKNSQKNSASLRSSPKSSHRVKYRTPIETNAFRESIADPDFKPEGCDEANLRLIACELILALTALHQERICYRDLKPKNVLATWSGHIKLSDFGLCVFLDDNGSVSHSAGTPGYMSPEAIQGADYGFATDIFSLGVTLFELFHGVGPFDPFQFAKYVKSEDRHVPEEAWHYHLSSQLSAQARDFLTQCLILRADRRLGSEHGNRNESGISSLQTHPWFDGIDWNAVMERRYRIPFLKASAIAFVDRTRGKPGHAMTVPAKIKDNYQDAFRNIECNTQTTEQTLFRILSDAKARHKAGMYRRPLKLTSGRSTPARTPSEYDSPQSRSKTAFSRASLASPTRHTPNPESYEAKIPPKHRNTSGDLPQINRYVQFTMFNSVNTRVSGYRASDVKAMGTFMWPNISSAVKNTPNDSDSASSSTSSARQRVSSTSSDKKYMSSDYLTPNSAGKNSTPKVLEKERQSTSTSSKLATASSSSTRTTRSDTPVSTHVSLDVFDAAH